MFVLQNLLMKKYCYILICIAAISCKNADTQAQEFTTENLEFDSEKTVADRNHVFKNLGIYPIKAKDKFKDNAPSMEKYASLNDGIKNKKVLVSEVNKGGTVNTLMLTNRSSDTVFIMAGEVVRGGKQDRTLAQDMILAPGDSNISIEAFCVEQGRWTPNSTTVANSNTYEFSAKGKTANMKMRKAAIVDKNQSKVWSKVADANANLGLTSTTGAYTVNDNDSTYAKNERLYQEYFQYLKSQKDIVGVVVVTGDKIVGADIFANNALFVKSFDNLLQSYINEVINDGRPVIIQANKVDAYIAQLLNPVKQADLLKKSGKLYKKNGKDVHLSSVMVD
jgi:hypothetical protein